MSKSSSARNVCSHGAFFQRERGKAAMNDDPRSEIHDPEIMPPVPKEEPERLTPEIPPDTDAPDRKAPIRGEN
jgi:hypothetical protein